MVEKRKRFKKLQVLIKLLYLKRELKEKIKNSLKKNHFIIPLLRLSFTINWYYLKTQFYKTYQKLVCPFSLSKKVPNQKFQYSRFFLNKKLNNFYINNVFK